MSHPALRPAYSYRDDPSVPSFDDINPVTFMDGECVLCTFGAQMIDRFDRKGRFRICPVQKELGRAMLQHYGLNPDDPESWLLIVDGQAYGSMDAMIRAGREVGGIGWALQVLRILPRALQDWLYVRLARNRYRLFGRHETCVMPGQRLLVSNDD